MVSVIRHTKKADIAVAHARPVNPMIFVVGAKFLGNSRGDWIPLE